MGKKIYINEIEHLFLKSPVVDSLSIKRILQSKKQVKQYHKHVLKNMLAKGTIKRITKGYYTAHNDPSLAVFCFAPAYLGLQDALSFHHIWEQETIPIIITSKNVRQGIRKIMGVNSLIKKIDKKYVFGVSYSGNLPYSDIEKTLIDFVYFNEKLSKESIKKIENIINLKKLNSYLIKYPSNFRKKVLDAIK